MLKGEDGFRADKIPFRLLDVTRELHSIVNNKYMWPTCVIKQKVEAAVEKRVQCGFVELQFWLRQLEFCCHLGTNGNFVMI
jgi:hypothetical protein